MSSHHHANAEHHAQEESARAPVAAPEADTTEHAERPTPQKPEGAHENLVPQDVPVVKPPVQSAIPAEAVKQEVAAQAVPGKDELTEAEKKIAPYIAAKLTSDLTDGELDLNFKEYANGNDKFGIKLCFQGEVLKSKSAELGHQVIKALHEHTAFAPLFKNAHASPHTHKGDQDDMMHILIPNLSREQYIALVNQVRGILPEPEKAEKTGTALTPEKKEHVETAAPVANEVPQSVVQGPVAALDKGVANDNDINAAAVGASR